MYFLLFPFTINYSKGSINCDLSRGRGQQTDRLRRVKFYSELADLSNWLILPDFSIVVSNGGRFYQIGRFF